jgi:hypothetical protein
MNKNVRSKEGEPIGYIVTHMKDSLHIETTASRAVYGTKRTCDGV